MTDATQIVGINYEEGGVTRYIKGRLIKETDDYVMIELNNYITKIFKNYIIKIEVAKKSRGNFHYWKKTN